METNDSMALDQQLAELRSELEQVHVPKRIETHLLEKFENLPATDPVIIPRRIKWWLPVGLAASIGAFMIGVKVLTPNNNSPISAPAQDPMHAYLVAHTQTPVRIHSLSRGTELRYLDTRVIRDERGITRIVYINLPQRY